MNDKIFYDTNVLRYAYDLNEPEKREICKSLVSGIFKGKHRGIISNQILAELYNALTRKLGVEAESARVIVESFIVSSNWVKIDYSHRTVRAAIDVSRTFRTPFPDTLIAETMKENGIVLIMTENEADFARLPGLDIRNPFIR